MEPSSRTTRTRHGCMVVEVIPIEPSIASTVSVQVSPMADRTRAEMSAGRGIDIVMFGQLYTPEHSSLQLEIPTATRKKTPIVPIRDRMASNRRNSCARHHAWADEPGHFSFIRGEEKAAS